MKHLFTLVLGLLVTIGYAQKKELKQAQKLFKASKVEEAKAVLSANQEIIEGTDDAKIKTKYHFLKGQIARLDKDFEVAYDNLKLAEGNASIKVLLGNEIQQLMQDIINAAIAQSESEDHISASENLYLAYQINPETSQKYLYISATSAVQGKDFELALERYIELRDLNYTGIETKYYVTDKATNEESEVQEVEYNIFLKSKDYINPRTEDSESKYPEIVKNIALIYNQLGQKDNAMKAVQDARKANPGDVGLILTEANIYIQLGEKQRYKELITEAIEQDPNNAVLYFNLGVVNNEQGDSASARGFYEKAIELDPSMENAYLNLVALILENESTIVEQMNSLGNSRADNMKYDELKKERETLYKECVPVLKQLIALDDSNLEAVQTLRNIYGTIGDNEGFMEMKAIMEKYEQ